MFVPFYDRIEKQEFRKHNDREFLIPETALLTYGRQLPAFQYITNDIDYVGKSELVEISSTGRELRAWLLPVDYITIVKVGTGEYRLQCNGDVLPESIPFSLFFIRVEVEETNGAIVYSEVFCKIREVESNGKILLNTDAFLLNNTGGNFLLNDYEEGYIIDEPIQLKYSANKSFGKFDLSNFVGTFFINSEINFSRSVEENDSENYDGLRTDFEKIVSSIYSVEFLASRQVCDLLNQLYFFENIEITDKDGCVYVPQEPVSVIKEREDLHGFYNITIEFKINNTLNYSELQTTPDEENTDIDEYIGMIFSHFGNNANINQILTARNAELINHEWISCDGQELLADDHPKLAQALGTTIISNLRKIQIPRLWGLLTAGIGTYEDSQANIETIGADVVGEIKHRLTIDEMATHKHPKGLGTTNRGQTGIADFPDTGLSGEAGNNEYHNNIQPTYGVYELMLIDKL